MFRAPYVLNAKVHAVLSCVAITNETGFDPRKHYVTTLQSTNVLDTQFNLDHRYSTLGALFAH